MINISLSFAGLLVLNVCWNGKQYMGTLLDTTRESSDHKWGPPRSVTVAATMDCHEHAVATF